MPIHMRMRKLRGPHMKKSMPFEPFRTHTQPVNISALESRFDAGTEVTIELMKANGLGTRKDIPVKVLAKGELNKALTVHAHAFSAGARERIEAAGGTCTTRRGLADPRPCGRMRLVAGPLESTLRAAGIRPARLARETTDHALDDPERLPGCGHPQEDRLHGGDAADLPLRLARAGAGRQPDRGQQHPEGVRRLEHPRAPEPVLRRRLSADRDLRAGDHALHHLLDHPAAAAGGRPVPGEALQGRRGRPGADHPVHPLPDRRPGLRPVDRLRLPLPHASRRKPANRSSATSTRRTSS